MTSFDFWHIGKLVWLTGILWRMTGICIALLFLDRIVHMNYKQQTTGTKETLIREEIFRCTMIFSIVPSDENTVMSTVFDRLVKGYGGRSRWPGPDIYTGFVMDSRRDLTVYLWLSLFRNKDDIKTSKRLLCLDLGSYRYKRWCDSFRQYLTSIVCFVVSTVPFSLCLFLPFPFPFFFIRETYKFQ